MILKEKKRNRIERYLNNIKDKHIVLTINIITNLSSIFSNIKYYYLICLSLLRNTIYLCKKL